MQFWRVCVLAFVLASGGASLAQSPRPAAGPPPQSSASVPAQADLHITRDPQFRIPIQLNGASGGEVVPVQVFFSTDNGKTWRKYKLIEVTANQRQFLEFRPPQDGEYWLTVVRLDELREPGFSPSSLTPQRRIMFDTRPPKLVLTGESAANGEILVTWQATDELLDVATLQLEYQDGARPNDWFPLEIDSRDVTAIENGIEGRTRFRPPSGARLVNVRADVRDQAKNRATVQRAVAITTGSGGLAGSKIMTPIAAEDLNGSPKPAAGSPTRLAGEPTPAKRPNTQERGAAQEQRVGSGAFGEPPSLAKQNPGRFAGYPRDQEDVGPIASESSLPPAALPFPSNPTATAQGDGDQVDTPRLINKKRFKLDYDIESVGAAGVADVELWGTTDRGQTWVKWGADPDLQSPLEVDVSGETLYGFRIVVVARNGLASLPPKSGEPADVWVQVDATPPQCRLTSVTYGQGEDAGKLDIRWEAADSRLAERPVTILMSDRPDAGYSVLAAGLPNTGQYLWSYDPRAPQQIYLRLEVRDEAGNVGVYQVTEPIRVEGLTPKGRIRGVAPIETGQRSPFRANLFK